MTPPSEGGRVEISLDGRSLVYTPPEGFTGTDVFQYTLSGETAAVAVHVSEAADLVRVRLEVTDPDGSPITLIEVGAEFRVNVWLEDLRDDPTGVFSAYLDVSFDAALAKAVGEITFGEDYVYGRSASLGEPGLVDDVGGFASLARVGGGEKLLASVPMVASDVGRATFSADPADILPAHELGLYDADQAVAASAIEFSGTVLEIVDGFQNTREYTDTNSDGATSPIDALLIVNFLNAYGARPVEALRSLWAAAGESEQAGRRRASASTTTSTEIVT